MERYTIEQERMMCLLYESLDEASKRRYAAVEAKKLGHGGKKYIRELFGCSYDTLAKGLKELELGSFSNNSGRIRREGGGRKPKKTISE